MHKAVKEMMETFMREGCTTNAIADRLTPFDEFNDFIGLKKSSRARSSSALETHAPIDRGQSTRRGRVAVLTLNRPEHGNRLTPPLAARARSGARAARDDAAVGACVLTGAGDVFCLGGDYRGAGPTDDGPRGLRATRCSTMDAAMARLGKPLDRGGERRRACGRLQPS